jgi:hypothetical protein
MRWSRLSRLAVWVTVAIAVLLVLTLYLIIWIAEHMD